MENIKQLVADAKKHLDEATLAMRKKMSVGKDYQKEAAVMKDAFAEYQRLKELL